MSIYNLTNITGSGNMTTILSFTQGVNDQLMFGWLGTILLIGIWFVIFISTMVSSNDGIKASMVSGFITFTLAVSLVALNLASAIALFVPLILTAVVVALSWGK